MASTSLSEVIKAYYDIVKDGIAAFQAFDALYSGTHTNRIEFYKAGNDLRKQAKALKKDYKKASELSHNVWATMLARGPLLVPEIHQHVSNIALNCYTSITRVTGNASIAVQSKAASVQMTRQLAFDFSHDNIKIRVNGIAPGTSKLHPPSPILCSRKYKIANNDFARLVPLGNDYWRFRRQQRERLAGRHRVPEGDERHWCPCASWSHGQVGGLGKRRF